MRSHLFPKIDNDDVIDGMELMLGITLIIYIQGDNKTDGEEYPLAGIPQEDPMVLD